MRAFAASRAHDGRLGGTVLNLPLRLRNSRILQLVALLRPEREPRTGPRRAVLRT